MNRRPAFRRVVRYGGMAAAGLVAVMLTATPAAADPAKPTDYRSTVTSVEPDVDGVSVEVVGGDGFLHVTVEPGHDVVVQGYDGEPWLHISSDGTVEENQLSPATYLNASRYGNVTPPADVDSNAPPRFETIGHDGQHIWHDHRIHWMSPDPPPNHGAGDVIFPDWTVAMTVDGTPVVVHGELVWVKGISPLPWFALALVVAAAALLFGRGKSILAAAIASTIAAAMALVVGAAQHAAVPAAAGGTPLLVVLPGIALVAGVTAIVLHRRPAAVIGVLASVAALGGWVLLRFAVLLKPVLPTNLSFNVDRAGTALTLGLIVAAAVLAVRSGGLAPRLRELDVEAD